jgi:hypothetical protein
MKLKDIIDDSTILRVFNDCEKIPDLDTFQKWNSGSKWPNVLVNCLLLVCTEQKTTVSRNLQKIFLKKYNIKLPVSDNHTFNSVHIINFMLKANECATGISNKVHISRLLFSYIFYEKGLYIDIILYYTALYNQIYKKLEELSTQENNKYNHYFAEYFIEHNRHIKSILLF